MKPTAFGRITRWLVRSSHIQHTGAAVRPQAGRAKWAAQGCGAIAAVTLLAACGFSIRLQWFQACQDIDAIEPTPADTLFPTVVYEQVGSIRVLEGTTRAKTGPNPRLRIEQSVEIPAYANQATVFLNGWQASYNDSDHHVYDVAAILGRIKVTPGQKISWTTIGDLADYDAKEAISWTCRYMVIAWNDTAVRAMVDHTDSETFCKSGEASGDDNYFEAGNDNATTALMSFPSFIQNAGFATGRQVAVLPRGFAFSWGGPGGGDDHHLLQLGYNLESVAPILRAQFYHKASATINPLGKGAADRAHGEFVSWKTSVIMKDNSLRRDYRFVEFVSGMGGPDVEIIQPEFTLLPFEDADGGFGGAGLKSADVVVENLPYLCAVPMLTGWELGYAPDDHHVKEFGIWIDRIRYERAVNASTGTLRYTVFSILKDNDDFPDNYFRHKVTILGLKRTDGIHPGDPAPRRE